MWKPFVAGFVTTALIFASGEAAAFEYTGFRSGMSLAEAEAVARSQGVQLLPVKASGLDMWSIGFYDSGRSIQFCRGRLFSLTENIGGGVDAFASTAKDLVAKYGPAAKVDARSGYTSDGLFSAVVLTWAVNDEEETTTITSYGGRPPYASFTLSAHSLCR